MKTVIAGSRNITDPQILVDAIEAAPFKITFVISGGAKGVDTLAEQWRIKNNLPGKVIPADWDRYGKKAGHIRNDVMARQAECLIAIWDGHSPGTRDMINLAYQYGVLVSLYKHDQKKPETI